MAPMGAREAISKVRPIYAVIAVLGLAPVIVVLVLRLPLINQLNYADAWFYSAYAWAPKHQFAVFGWNYFSVRFPAVLAIGVFQRAFGTGDGYVLLRYALTLGCGVAVYLCVRRFASMRIAACAAVLLYLNPFFSRMLLWDYSGFMEIAGGVIGIATWYWSDDRRLVWTLLPGAALASAIFANALVGTALLVLLLIEAIAAIRQGRQAVLRYGTRLAVMAVAALGVFVVGYLGYLVILGSLSPYDLLRPTIKFFGENNRQAAQYQYPVSGWLLHEPRIWAPIIICGALLATLRGRLLNRDVPARIAQLFIGYTVFLWLYRFVVVSSVIETWWAYSVVVVAMGPAVGVLLSEFGHVRPTTTRWSIAAMISLVLTVVLLRDATGPASRLYHALAIHEALLVGLIAMGLAAGVLAAVLRHATGRGASLAILAIVAGMAFYAPSVLDGRGTTGLFVTNGAREWTAYQAGKRFIDLIEDYDNPQHRVFLWFPGTTGYVSLTWSDLPQEADTLNEIGVDESINHLTPLGIARLQQPQVRYVMILAPRTSELVAARTALLGSGLNGSVVRSGWLVGNALGFELVAK
jgi:hypothetical protein